MQHDKRFQMKQKRFEDTISKKKCTKYCPTQFFNISLTIYVVQLCPCVQWHSTIWLAPVALERVMKLIQNRCTLTLHKQLINYRRLDQLRVAPQINVAAMGVGESVYYHCTSREGALHTQFTDSTPQQTLCGPPSVAPSLIPLFLFCPSFIHWHPWDTTGDPSTPALQLVYAAFYHDDW